LKKSLIISFLRYQVAAIIATMVDFFVLIILTELFDVWYVASTAAGAFCGALTNFIICRYWAFVNSSNNLANQAVKYTIVSAGSLILNTLFVYLLTDFAGVTYSISKIITAIIIAIFYNFTLQKYYVFKQ
jgi:putative flippase GtrA